MIQNLPPLSIPSWSDFNAKISRSIMDRLRYFQSHLGLISTLIAVLYFNLNPVHLSIPSWSDFNFLRRHLDKLENQIFQSHLGLISTSGNISFISYLKLSDALFDLYTVAHPKTCRSFIKMCDFYSGILFQIEPVKLPFTKIKQNSLGIDLNIKI